MGLPQFESPPSEDMDTAQSYPAPIRHAGGEVNGINTSVTNTIFSDKIMITISQGGRLAQWFTVPLLNDNPTQSDPYFQTISSGDDALLPASRFIPRTLLGAGSSTREVTGQLYASQIANAIATKSPEESRTLLLGLGLDKAEMDRDEFLAILNLVLEVL